MGVFLWARYPCKLDSRELRREFRMLTFGFGLSLVLSADTVPSPIRFYLGFLPGVGTISCFAGLNQQNLYRESFGWMEEAESGPLMACQVDRPKLTTRNAIRGPLPDVWQKTSIGRRDEIPETGKTHFGLQSRLNVNLPQIKFS